MVVKLCRSDAVPAGGSGHFRPFRTLSSFITDIIQRVLTRNNEPVCAVGQRQVA